MTTNSYTQMAQGNVSSNVLNADACWMRFPNNVINYSQSLSSKKELAQCFVYK